MPQPEAVQPLINSGMARQFAAFRHALAEGMPRLGWKVAFNDPAIQQRMGLTATLVGWLVVALYGLFLVVSASELAAA